MEYKLSVLDALCVTREFEINNIDADYQDFVDKYDHSPESAEDYGCGNMSCDILDPKQEVLEKYDINEGEYYIIAHKLSEKLSFGPCGWCV